jgi:hypothetical protein
VAETFWTWTAISGTAARAAVRFISGVDIQVEIIRPIPRISDRVSKMTYALMQRSIPGITSGERPTQNSELNAQNAKG